MKKLAKVKVKKYAYGGYGLNPDDYNPDQTGRYNASINMAGGNNSALGRDVGATTTQGSNINWNQAGNYAKVGAGALAAISANYNNPNGTTQQNTAAAANAGVDAIAGAVTPWYAMANGAQKAGRGMIKKDTIVDPTTGEAKQYFRNDADYALNEAMKPSHEAVIDDVTKGNYLGALAHSNLGTGLIYDLATNKYGKMNSERSQAQAQAEQAEADRIAAEQEAERLRKYNQQMNYTKAYNTANPVSGREGAGIYAKGGRLMSAYCSYGNGGVLNPISSVATKAVGDTHEEGGITLQSNGVPIAEVEDGEIISQGKVFSNKLKARPGVTYAKEAENLERKRGKLEESTNTNNYREKNSATRMMNNVNQDINNLFAMQEASKAKSMPKYTGLPKAEYGMDLYKPKRRELTPEELQDEQDYASRNAPGNYNKIDWNRAGQQITPYLDNIYNEGIINSTPQIPNPTNRVAYDINPVTLKTNYNINPSLNSANANYGNLVKNLDQSTANAPTARANKLAGFASLLNNTSSLYNTKENTETQLANQSNMNVQNIIGRNAENQQNIANQNIGLKDNFNYARMQRQSDMNRMRSENFTNAVENMTTQAQDRNLETLDQQRIMTDALKYNDSAGFARSVGSPTMTNIIRSNPQYYYQIEKSLKSSGQNDALKEFYKTYGRKSK
jgi:hypothetical protein